MRLRWRVKLFEAARLGICLPEIVNSRLYLFHHPNLLIPFSKLWRKSYCAGHIGRNAQAVKTQQNSCFACSAACFL